jgi:hypothetical protein
MSERIAPQRNPAPATDRGPSIKHAPSPPLARDTRPSATPVTPFPVGTSAVPKPQKEF